MIFTPKVTLVSRDEPSIGFWRAQIFGWLILAGIGLCARLVVFRNLEMAVWLTLCLEPLAFAVTSAAATLRSRCAPECRLTPAVLAGGVLLCLVTAATLSGLGHLIHQLFDPSTLPVEARSQFRLGFIYYTGLLLIWMLIYFGVEAELAARNERIAKMNAETRALKLELEHLHMQIEPHFLFNSLNTIVAEVSERPQVAEEMTRRLAGYLRYSLDRRGAGLSRVEDDIDAAQAYLDIQALRFECRLECQCRIDPAALDRLIPHMTLQGLVENAIKHGMRETHAAFRIGIRVRCCRDNELLIEVDNPGALHAPFDVANGGGGLGNLCRRLELRYPEGYDFSLIQRGPQTVARLRLRGEATAL